MYSTMQLPVRVAYQIFYSPELDISRLLGGMGDGGGGVEGVLKRQLFSGRLS